MARITALPKAERDMVTKLHEIATANAPALNPQTY